MNGNAGSNEFQKFTEPILRKLIENIESPYVWMPLGLFVLCVLAYPITNFVGFSYLAVAFVLLALGADWVGRIRNRQLPELHLELNNITQEADRLVERASSQSFRLREQGKLSAANTVIDKARKSIYDELARLANKYVQMRETKSPGWERTSEMEDLVREIRDVTRRAAIQALQPDVLLNSTDAGERVVGLAVLEEFPNASYFEQVLDRIINSESAFEQYRALRVIEGMLPTLGSNQCKRLKVALEDQMSGGETKWIKRGTDRWTVASRILGAIR
jgi:hypothetical protein